ncbi:hypothetical protein DEU56DRAFT_430281 [Suillus clintonianus]|uniref:uncharacterized protein n=1 Tax=Suillus clintonianus TaxID=1904413 RepID=UPI001B86004E|nr:uncharacterized protein DEU56DRAFT_430281 [Suillus clintonianus]KAG2153963.1 hypothetical protein DEU56DRAFT_430281 [Suillus clintonianus]
MLQSLTTCPTNGFVVPHPTMISSPNHPGQPDSYDPRMSDSPSSGTGYNHHNYAQQHYSTLSVSAPKPRAISIPPQSIHSVSSPTAANRLTYISNRGSWNNPPTSHSTQHHEPVLWDTTFGYFCSPAMRNNYSSPYTFPMRYPDVHHSYSTSSSQHTVAEQDIRSVFRESTSSYLPPYNELPPHQWQNSTIPQSGPLSGPFPPMIPPPLAAETSQIGFLSRPHANHSEYIYYPSDQPPTHQPYFLPLRNHLSSPLLSCRWLDDGTVCAFTGTLKALKAHCKTSHFGGPPNAQAECHWEACDL